MFNVSPEDTSFLHAFEACAVPPSEFDHRAHLRLAYVYLAERDLDGAHAATKTAILGFLQHNGIDPAKYHETLTLAWLLAVRHFMAKCGDTSCAADFIDRSAVLLNPGIMLTHYSKDVLFSDDARTKFREPNLDPIPTHDTVEVGKETVIFDSVTPGK